MSEQGWFPIAMLFTSCAADRYQTVVCTAKPLPAFERIPRTKMHRFCRSDINYFVLMRTGSCAGARTRAMFFCSSTKYCTILPSTFAVDRSTNTVEIYLEPCSSANLQINLRLCLSVAPDEITARVAKNASAGGIINSSLINPQLSLKVARESCIAGAVNEIEIING